MTFRVEVKSGDAWITATMINGNLATILEDWRADAIWYRLTTEGDTARIVDERSGKTLRAQSSKAHYARERKRLFPSATAKDIANAIGITVGEVRSAWARKKK